MHTDRQKSWPSVVAGGAFRPPVSSLTRRTRPRRAECGHDPLNGVTNIHCVASRWLSAHTSDGSLMEFGFMHSGATRWKAIPPGHWVRSPPSRACRPDTAFHSLKTYPSLGKLFPHPPAVPIRPTSPAVQRCLRQPGQRPRPGLLATSSAAQRRQ